VAIRGALVVIVTPQVATAGHAQRREHRFLHVRVDGHAGDPLDDLLKINKTLTGVTKSLAGREIDEQPIIVAPVPKAGAMTEDEARGDLVDARVVDVGLGKILRE